MKQKIICIAVAILISVLAILVAVLALTNFFTKGVITGKLYRVDNVYEEIWNLVNSEKNGTQTILTGSIDGASVRYGWGSFEQVCIPVKDNYSVSLSFGRYKFDQDELIIWLSEKNSTNHDTACYVYNYQTNTLYGNQAESHLIDKFISFYYSLVGNDGRFNSANLGDYTFVFEEYPLSHK